MKTTILLFVTVLLTSVVAHAQVTVENQPNKKVISVISDNLVDVQFEDIDGNVLQKGQYWITEGRYKPHGIWTLYTPGTDKILTSAKFEKGEKLWLETHLDGKKVKLDQEQLRIIRLEEKIAQLEKQLAEKNE